MSQSSRDATGGGIKVGDLVQVIKPRLCGCMSSVGKVFTVTHIRQSLQMFCVECGADLGHDKIAEGLSEISVTPLWRLKRIPPLSELEGQRTEEDLREPA